MENVPFFPRWLAVAGGLAAVGLLGWALFWPDRACAQPACARDRFAITIEVDAFGQVAPIDFEVPADGGRVSLQSILRGAGVEVGWDGAAAAGAGGAGFSAPGGSSTVGAAGAGGAASSPDPGGSWSDPSNVSAAATSPPATSSSPPVSTTWTVVAER